MPADPTHPLGPSHRTDAAALLLLTAAQLDAAAALWRQYAPPAFRDLLAREPGDLAAPTAGAVPTAGAAPTDHTGTPTATPPGRFDPDTQRYSRPNGRPVPSDSIRAALLLFLAAVGWDLEHLAEQAAVGESTVGHWQDTAAPVIVSAYVAGYALGVGGLSSLTDADLDAVRATAADGLTRLDRFAGLVAARDDAADTVDAVVNRAGMYAGPVHSLYEAARGAAHLRAGFTHERSMPDPAAEHCGPSGELAGCLELADAGWVPIGTLARPGERSCGPRCRCWMAYDRQEAPEPTEASV